MIAPALKGAHSPSAPLALVALAPPAGQKGSTFPPNPLTSPPVAAAESVPVTSVSTPVVPSDPKASSGQVPSQVVPNPKGTSICPGKVDARPPHHEAPLASSQCGWAACPELAPISPLVSTPPQVQGDPAPSTLTPPQNLVTGKEPLASPAASSFSAPVPPMATSQKTVTPSDPLFLPTLGSLPPLSQITPSNPTVENISSGHSHMGGVSYPSQRSVIPPIPLRNETVPAAGTAFPLAPPSLLHRDRGTSALTSVASQGSSDTTNQQQPLVTRDPLTSPGSPGLKEMVSSVGATPLVMTGPSIISVVPRTIEATTGLSPPVSSGPINSKSPTSQAALVKVPMSPPSQGISSLETPDSAPLSAFEDSRSVPTSILVKLPSQKDFQTLPASPAGVPVSPAQAGHPSNKDSPPSILAIPKDSPSPQSTSSLERSLSPEATLAKKSLVEPLPGLEPASIGTFPPGVLNSPTSVIQTNPSPPTVASTGLPSKKDSATPTGVALGTAKGTSTSVSAASPFLEGAISSLAGSHPSEKGPSTLATLPSLPSSAGGCLVSPAVASSPQDFSASPVTLPLVPEIPKSVPFPSLTSAGIPSEAKKVDSISYALALAPAASPEGPPGEASDAPVTVSSKGSYLVDNPSTLRTSAAPQTERHVTKKDSTPPALTLAPVSQNEPVPVSLGGNLPTPVSPLEASLLPEVSLSCQGPQGLQAKKHPSPKGPPTSTPGATPPTKGVPGTPSSKKSPTPSPVAPLSAKKALAGASPKEATTPPPTALPSDKPTVDPATQFTKDLFIPPPAAPSKGAPTPPVVLPPKGALTTQSTSVTTPLPVAPSPSKSKKTPAAQSTEDVPTPPPAAPSKSKKTPAAQSTEDVPTPPPAAPSKSKKTPAAQSTEDVPTPPPAAPSKSKKTPAAQSTEDVPTPPPVAPSKSKRTPAAQSTGNDLTPPPVTSKSKGGPPTTQSINVPIPPPITSSKGIPAAPSPKGAEDPTSPLVATLSPKGIPTASSLKETPTAPSVTPPSSKSKGAPAVAASRDKGTAPPVTPPSPKDAPIAAPVTPPSSKSKGAAAASKDKGSAPPVTPPSPKETPISPETLPSPKDAPAALSPKDAPSSSKSKGAPAASKDKGAAPPVTPPSPKDAPAAAASKDKGAAPPVTPPSSKETPIAAPVTPPSSKSKGAPAVAASKDKGAAPLVTPPSPKDAPIAAPVSPPKGGAPAASSRKVAPAPPPVAPPSSKSKGAAATQTTRDVPTPPPVVSPPTTLSSKDMPAPPHVTLPSSKSKGAPAASSPKGAPTSPPVTPPSTSKGGSGTPSPKAASATPPTKNAPTLPPVVTPSKETPAAPSSQKAPTPPSVTPPSSKKTPTTPSPKEFPTSPAAVICPLEAIPPQTSKGLSSKKCPAALKEVLITPTPESASAINAPTQKDLPAKKGSAPSPSSCPHASAKHDTEVSAPKAPAKTTLISPMKGKDPVHAPKVSLVPPPESKTSTPLASPALETVLPKTGSASVSPAPAPPVSLPLAPSPVPPLLPKQQFLPSSPGLVLESPHKPPASADEDELPPLIPPEPISGGVPFQPVLVNMPTPKSAGIPAPTPSAKQPILKNNKGICLGLLCAWCVAHPLLGAAHQY
ncbi:uncharacterized protein LOC142450014 [Tenrec ecaudatus]|uniref:uncharacterized protein LOC142450014 n=1 Tax=Tenrec ecaudatus TaxID=94439 RepID=UPI003F5AA538